MVLLSGREHHAPEVFKTRLVQDDGWDADDRHVKFAPFDTICFKLFISKPYFEETCSHVITSSASSSPLLYLASVVKDCER